MVPERFGGSGILPEPRNLPELPEGRREDWGCCMDITVSPSWVLHPQGTQEELVNIMNGMGMDDGWMNIEKISWT